MMEIKGRCHCDAMSFNISWPVDVGRIGRACTCRYCQNHGAIWISNPGAIVSLPADYKNTVVIYRFGHKTADFCFCRICGVLCIAICNLESELVAVVNVKSFEYSKDFLEEISRTDFSSEKTTERLGRRTTNWSPVRFF